MHVDPTARPKLGSSETSQSGAAKNKPLHGAPEVPLRSVLSAIGEHEPTRRRVLDRFKASGGSLDGWHERKTHQAMADALTFAEDALELETHGRCTPLRSSLRALRRRLENKAFA